MLTTTSKDLDVAILARVLGNDTQAMPAEIARYLARLEFGTRDKERMHELATRNQDDDLSDSEKAELHAYVRTGTILSILKSKARQSLKTKPKKRTSA